MAAQFAPTQFNFPGMMPMQSGKLNPSANGEMGMKLLQAALAQQKQGQGQPAAPAPEVGQTMPGGAMNIVPPPQNSGGMTLFGNGGMGLLSKLLGKGGVPGMGGGMPGMADAGGGGMDPGAALLI